MAENNHFNQMKCRFKGKGLSFGKGVRFVFLTVLGYMVVLGYMAVVPTLTESDPHGYCWAWPLNSRLTGETQYLMEQFSSIKHDIQ